MAELPKLVMRMGFQTADLDRGLEAAAQKVSAFGQAATGAMGRATAAAQETAGAADAVGGAAAGAAGQVVASEQRKAVALATAGAAARAQTQELVALTAQQANQIGAGGAFLAQLREQAATYGMTRRELLQYRAAQLGVTEQATPLISAIDQAHKRLGSSAGQMTQAIRMLPAQLSDVATQLAGGQSPFLVLMQQGLQTRDMFGGFKPMFEGISAALTPVALGLGAAAAAIGVVGYAVYRGYQQMLGFSKALVDTGNFAGTTAEDLDLMAARIGAATGATGKATQALTQLASTGEVGADQLEALGRVAVQMSKDTGANLGEVGKILKGITGDTEEWARKYNETHHILSAGQLDLIEKYTLSGDRAAALQLVIDSLDARHTEFAANAQQQLGGLAQAYSFWGSWIDRISSKLANSLKPDSMAERIGKQIEVIEGLQGKIQSLNSQPIQFLVTKQLDAAQAQLATEMKILGTLRDQADAEREKSRAKAAGAQSGQMLQDLQGYTGDAKFATKEQQRNNALEQEAKRYNGIIAQFKEYSEGYRGATEKERADYQRVSEEYVAAVKRHHSNLAKIEEQYKEKPDRAGARAAQNALSGQMASIEQEGKLREEALKRNLANVERLRRSGQITEEEAISRSFDAREKGLQAELDQARRLEDLASGKKELAAREKYHGERVRIEAELAALGQQRLNATQDQADKLYRLQKEQDERGLLSLEQRIVAVRQETELYGRLPSAIEAVTVARLQERRAAIAMLDPMSEQLKAIDAEIDARSRLREALSAKEATEQRYNLAKKTAEEWNRVAGQIGQGLTDSLFRAFEAGGDFGRTFFDGLKNMAKTTLLRIPLQFVQEGLGGLLGSLFGSGGTGSAGGSSFGAALTAGQRLNSLYSFYNNAGSWYNTALSFLGLGGQAAIGGTVLGGGAALGSGTFAAGSSVFASGMPAAASYTLPANILTGASNGAIASGVTGGAAGGSTMGLGAGMFAGPQAIVGAVLAGMAINDSLFSKGWDIQKTGFSYGSTLKADLLGTVLSGGLLAPGTISLASTGVKFADKALRGLGLSDRMASLISGSAIVSALFGRKAPEVQSAGLAGDFTASGFNGSAYVDWLAKGGWFRSDKRWTNYSALDQQQSDVLNGAVQSSLGFYRRLDKSAGGTGLEDRLGSFKYSVRRDMRGENAVEQLLNDLSQEMGRQLIPELTRLQRSGESITDTAKRLTDVFDATNVAASVLGKTTAQAFGDVGLATTAARQRLVDLAGGLDSFNSKVADYYAGYFSDEEKITRLRDQLREQFAELGLVMPATRREFRELVESFDLRFEWGQDTVNGLLALAPAFGQVADASAAAEAAMKAFSDQVKTFQQQLLQGNLSTLTPQQQYEEARKRYEEVSAKAAGGDKEASSQWTQIAQAFLEASRAYYASSDRYAADFDKVQRFRPDGSHANGLGFVPFDGYMAELHRGERVLTRSENERYSQGAAGRYVEGRAAPDWSQYGHGASVALVGALKAALTELEAMRSELAAMRQERAVSTQAVEQQTAARHAEVMQVQRDQRRLTQTLVDNQ